MGIFLAALGCPWACIGHHLITLAALRRLVDFLRNSMHKCAKFIRKTQTCTPVAFWNSHWGLAAPPKCCHKLLFGAPVAYAQEVRMNELQDFLKLLRDPGRMPPWHLNWTKTNQSRHIANKYRVKFWSRFWKSRVDSGNRVEKKDTFTSKLTSTETRVVLPVVAKLCGEPICFKVLPGCMIAHSKTPLITHDQVLDWGLRVGAGLEWGWGGDGDSCGWHWGSLSFPTQFKNFHSSR